MEPLKKLHKDAVEPFSFGNIIHKIDRISRLPDDLLYHILSFLDVFDVVRAGLLSKRWVLLCSSLPFVDIDIPKLCQERNLEVLNAGHCYKFQNLICWVLSSRSAVNIVRLRLICHQSGVIFRQDQVFIWMCIAAKRNVQELIISCDPVEMFRMPFSLVSLHSLQKLELNLNGKSLHLCPGFPHLRYLCLTNIKLTDENSTRSFFSGCPVLNKLVLNICFFEGMNVLHISSVSIQHLYFEDGNRYARYDEIDLKISCPNLLAFKYGAPAPRKYISDGMPSLETMHIHPLACDPASPIEIASCVYRLLQMEHKIVDLKLGEFIIEGFCDMGDELKFTRCSFHGLKVLTVWLTVLENYMRFLSVLLEHCPNIEALTIYFSERYHDHIPELEDFTKISCLRSTVKTIRLIDFIGEDDEIDLARNLLKAGLVLKKFMICWCMERLMDEEIVKRVLSFDRPSAFVEIVSMDFDARLFG